VSDLTALLEHEASAEIEAILAQARERAAALLAQASSEAEAAAAARDRAATLQRDAVRVRAQSAAQLEASALKLRAQHDAVEAVFADVEERIAALPTDAERYRSMLDALLDEVLAALGEEAPSEIVAAPSDIELVTALAAARGVRAPVVAGDVRAGVRVRTGRGSSIENSLPGRLATLRSELTSRVTEVLFGDTTAA
jgi:vacuolar-type H+-ATPase subunit E/Vma4